LLVRGDSCLFVFNLSVHDGFRAATDHQRAAANSKSENKDDRKTYPQATTKTR
jgi:hypothetical protein